MKNKRLIIGWTIWTALWWGLHIALFVMWYHAIKALPELNLPLFDRHDILSLVFAIVVYSIGLGKWWLIVERWPSPNGKS
jgi:hypothetical protein